MSERSFEEHLKRAMLLTRDFRLHAVAQNLDPRAVRIAIKYMAIVDDHFAQKKLDAKSEAFCEQVAMKLAQETMKVANKDGLLHDT